MNMNNWTISRRITAGLSALVLLTLLIGTFAFLRMQEMSQSITELSDNSVPSIVTLHEISRSTRRQAIAHDDIAAADVNRRAALVAVLAKEQAELKMLVERYETSLIEDEEDRRLFGEIKLGLADVQATARQYAEKPEVQPAEASASAASALEPRQESRVLLSPAQNKLVAAIDDNVRYNEKVARAAGDLGKSLSASAMQVLKISVVFVLLLAIGISFFIVRSTSRVLGEIIGSLDASALQTASAARQVSMASQMLSSGASDQASAVEETSASLEEISSMVRATADNAERAKDLAAQARGVAEEGGKIMVDMRLAMTAIDASGAEVAKIVKNIDEIAFQTNILALNAAVEAARAGEAGAGFAVVADEVRSLAQRSAAAARETADKIDAAIANSRRGAECTAQVGRALEQITDKVTATDSLVGEIASAASEQAQGIEQVGVAVNQMEQIAQSNSISSEESAAAAEQLDAQAEMMKGLVGRLRALISGGSATASHTRESATAGSSARYGRPIKPTVPTAVAHNRPASAPAPAPAAISGSRMHALGNIPMPEPKDGEAGSGSFRNF
jgi:methyl-accepting chemotaxis protein